MKAGKLIRVAKSITLFLNEIIALVMQIISGDRCVGSGLIWRSANAACLVAACEYLASSAPSVGSNAKSRNKLKGMARRAVTCEIGGNHG